MRLILTGAGFPFVTAVQSTGDISGANGGHLGSEPGPVQLGVVTLALVDKEERITVASASVE